jgi:hypothetical protein
MDDRNTNSFLIHYNRVGRIQRSGGRGSSPYFWKSNRAPLSPSYEREEEGENERPEEEGESPP